MAEERGKDLPGRVFFISLIESSRDTERQTTWILAAAPLAIQETTRALKFKTKKGVEISNNKTFIDCCLHAYFLVFCTPLERTHERLNLHFPSRFALPQKHLLPSVLWTSGLRIWTLASFLPFQIGLRSIHTHTHTSLETFVFWLTENIHRLCHGFGGLLNIRCEVIVRHTSLRAPLEHEQICFDQVGSSSSSFGQTFRWQKSHWMYGLEKATDC